LYLNIRFFANSLLVSILAAAFVGPKIRRLFSLNTSTIPFSRAASGPTTVKSILFSFAKCKRESISVALISKDSHSLISLLPGAA
jgi:hypothetical protein